MLELGSDFDDSLFGETKATDKGKQSEPYHVKVCVRKWFEGEKAVENTADLHDVFKYRGDLLYYQGHYGAAITSYNKCLEVLDARNTTVWRDVQEAKIRCFMSEGDEVSVRTTLRKVVEASKNFEQKTSVLNLMADINQKFGHNEAELDAVQSLIMLHPTNHDLWIRLADIYLRLADFGTNMNTTNSGDFQATSDTTNISSNSNSKTEFATDTMNRISETTTSTASSSLGSGLLVQDSASDCIDSSEAEKMTVLTCLLRAKQLIKSVQHCVGSFTRSRLLNTQEMVDADIQKLCIPEEKKSKCWTVLTRLKQEDESYQDDVEKLKVLQRLTRQDFEHKWFPWTKVKPDDNLMAT